MIHLLAKSAEMRGEEEIGMNAGDLADRAGTQRARDAPHARQIATVLHDGVDAPGGLGAHDEIARVRERLGHRLFAQDMAARRESRRDDLMPGRGHDDVEEDVRAALGKERMNVAGDDGDPSGRTRRRAVWRARRRGRQGRQSANRGFSRPPAARPGSSRHSRRGRLSAPSTPSSRTRRRYCEVDRKRLRSLRGGRSPCQAAARASNTRSVRAKPSRIERPRP